MAGQKKSGSGTLGYRYRRTGTCSGSLLAGEEEGLQMVSRQTLQQLPVLLDKANATKKYEREGAPPQSIHQPLGT